MRFPVLFPRENSAAARRERVAKVERVLTDSLRTMAAMISKLADTIEKQRLSRSGHEQQGTFLERLDKK